MSTPLGTLPRGASLPAMADNLRKRGKLTAADTQASLLAPTPGARSDPFPAGTSNGDLPGATLLLPVDSIRRYEKNPRLFQNSQFQELKERIRAGGFIGTIPVTRRPGDVHYTTYAGAGTRLTAVQELWHETGDERFAAVKCDFYAWAGEAELQVAHLAENVLREDLSFWERAVATLAIQDALAAETGKEVGLRELADYLQSVKLDTNLTTLSYYVFTRDHLGALGIASKSLSRNDVRNHIIPLYRSLERVVDMARRGNESPGEILLDFGIAPAAEAEQQAVLAGGEFDVRRFCQAFEQAVARYLGLEPGALQRRRALLDASGKPAAGNSAPIAEPAVPSPPAPAGAAGSPAAPPPPAEDEVQDHPAGGTATTVVTAPAAIPQLPLPASAHRPEAADPFAGIDCAALLHQIRHAADGLRQALSLPPECLLFYDALPLGFAVDAPRPVERAADWSLPQKTLFWYLASLSGQLEDPVARRLPPDSPWRQQVERDASGASGRVDDVDAPSCDPAAMDWNQDMVPAFWLALDWQPEIVIGTRQWLELSILRADTSALLLELQRAVAALYQQAPDRREAAAPTPPRDYAS